MTSLQWQPASHPGGGHPLPRPDTTPSASNIWFGISLLLLGFIVGVELTKLWLAQLQ